MQMKRLHLRRLHLRRLVGDGGRMVTLGLKDRVILCATPSSSEGEPGPYSK